MKKPSSSNVAETSHPLTSFVYFLFIKKLFMFSPSSSQFLLDAVPTRDFFFNDRLREPCSPLLKSAHHHHIEILTLNRPAYQSLEIKIWYLCQIYSDNQFQSWRTEGRTQSVSVFCSWSHI